MLSSLQRIETKVGTLTTDIGDVKTRISRLEDSSGNINEKLLRSEIAKMYGENFSKQYTVNSLQGLVQLLSEANGLDVSREPSEIYFEARKIARMLAETKVANQMLSEFYEIIISNFSDSLQSPRSQTGSEGTVQEETILKLFCAGVISNFQGSAAVDDQDRRVLQAFKKSLILLELPTKEKRQKNLVDPLKKKLNELCRLLTTRNLSDQVSTLVKCGGPGMMIAQYIAKKKRLVNGEKDQKEMDQQGAKPGANEEKLGLIWRFLPSFELEMDVKGSVVVVGNAAFIKVAEIKSSHANSRKAKHQIRDSAIVLQWALQELRPNVSQVTLAGHIFVNSSDEFSGGMNYVDSSGMSIFVHPM
jgi:hypothetical protein